MFETRCRRFILKTMPLPSELAETGKVSMSGENLSKLTGALFIEKIRMNHLCLALDKPDFFWNAPDIVQVGGAGNCGCAWCPRGTSSADAATTVRLDLPRRRRSMTGWGSTWRWSCGRT